MEQLSAFLTWLDGYLGAAQYFPVLLLAVGLFFTLYLGFPQVRYFNQAWRTLSGRYDLPSAPGDTTRFQALSTALSGTVGTGNIGGVALALHLGGPAALFWMWVTAFVGMTTKFVEVVISYKYRVTDAEGHMAGGPMYYMERGLGMHWLAVLFAIACTVSSFGIGNLPQSNNIAIAVERTFGISTAVTGAALAIVLGLVIIGGIRRIARVTASIVPFMAVAYTGGALAVIVTNLDNVIPSFVAVFRDALTGSAAAGGFLGASLAYAFNRGVNRGLFSNEAGQGSSPIAHASARGREPVSEGFVAILEPFIDTIVLCTLTGMVILASGVWKEKFDNVFEPTDTAFVAGAYAEARPADVNELSSYLSGHESSVQPFNGRIRVEGGEATTGGFSVLHARSVAEDVRYRIGEERPFTGLLTVSNGKLVESDIELHGRSLVHSAALTVEAFNESFLGDIGPYIVTFALLLFAFSTAISWSYYGDRCVTFLFGTRAVMPYRMFYVAGFFIATIIDTSLVWQVAAITMVLTTLPNLLGLVLMRREIRDEVTRYWQAPLGDAPPRARARGE